MRGKFVGLMVVALLAGGTAWAMQTGDDVLKKIQGRWQFTEHVMGGKPAPADQLKKMIITFERDKFTVRDGDTVMQAGTHKFDPSKTPTTVDCKITEGEGKDTTMLGIFELKDDTIRVCFDPTGKERPTSFDAKGENIFTAVVKRVK